MIVWIFLVTPTNNCCKGWTCEDEIPRITNVVVSFEILLAEWWRFISTSKKRWIFRFVKCSFIRQEIEFCYRLSTKQFTSSMINPRICEHFRPADSREKCKLTFSEPWRAIYPRICANKLTYLIIPSGITIKNSSTVKQGTRRRVIQINPLQRFNHYRNNEIFAFSKCQTMTKRKLRSLEYSGI